MLPAPSTAPAAIDVAERYIRPLAGREIRGLAWAGEDLLVLDARTGRLALVDPATDGTRVVNDGMAGAFLDAGGLALAEGALWFTTAEGLHRARWLEDAGRAATDPRLSHPELVLPIEGASAVAVLGSRVHLVRGRTLEVREVAALDVVVAQVELHGIGRKGIAATAGCALALRRPRADGLLPGPGHPGDAVHGGHSARTAHRDHRPARARCRRRHPARGLLRERAVPQGQPVDRPVVGGPLPRPGPDPPAARAPRPGGPAGLVHRPPDPDALLRRPRARRRRRGAARRPVADEPAHREPAPAHGGSGAHRAALRARRGGRPTGRRVHDPARRCRHAADPGLAGDPRGLRHQAPAHRRRPR